MSFGGGRDSYTLEYIIKVVNQGGTSGISQVNTGLSQVNKNVNNVAMSQEKLMMIQDKVASSQQKVIQAQQGVTKGMKGLAFGILGVTTAGAEFVGMMSMWRQTSAAVTEAQDEVNRALKESGKNSKDYKDAVNDLAKANRWARMTFRNLMLSMFDMVPFFILTINGIVKLRNAYKFLREAQLEQKAMQEVLRKSNIGLAESNLLANTSYTKLSKAQRIMKAEQALMIRSNELLAASNTQLAASNLSVNGSLITSIPLLGKTEKSMGILGRTGSKLSGIITGVGAAVSGLLGKILKIAIPIAAIVIAAEAWKNNWGGVGDVMNQLGVKIGNIHPILKTTMEWFAKIGLAIDALIHGRFSEIGGIISGTNNKVGDSIEELSDKEQKALDEAAQALKQFQDESMSTLFDFGQSEKDERNDWLVKFGIKDKGKGIEKDFKGFRKILDNAAHEMEQASAKFNALEGINILESLNLDTGLDKKTIAKIRSTLGSDFEDMFKGSDDIFSQLGAVIKQHAKDSSPDFNNAILEFVNNHPGLMTALEKLRPELAAQLQAFVQSAKDEAAKKLTAEQKADALWDAAFKAPEVHRVFRNGVDVTDQLEGEKLGKAMGTGFINGLKEAFGATGGTDWAGVGAAFREGLLKIFTIANAVKLGSLIRANIIDPIFVALGEALRPALEEFKKDPIGFTVGAIDMATGWISAFVAGLFGYKNEQDMNEGIKNQIKTFLEGVPVLNGLRMLINDPIGGLIALLTGQNFMGSESVDIDPRTVGPKVKSVLGIPSMTITSDDIMKGLGITSFFDAVGEAWREVEKLIDGAGAGIAAFLKDPIGWFINTIKNQKSGPNGQQKIDPNTGNKIPQLPPSYRPPGTQGYNPTSLTGDGQYSNLVFNPNTMAQNAHKARTVVILAMQDMVTKVVQQFEHMAEVFSIVANSFGANAESGSSQVQEHISNLWSFTTQVFDSLGVHWSDTVNLMIRLMADAASDIYDQWHKGAQNVADNMDDLAKHWSAVCNSMIKNAKSAANGINNQLDNIKKEVVTVHRIITVGSLAHGGPISLAQGGPISAAGGRMLTTSGPTYLVGDNPGGRESIWAIPHDNPAPTVAKIDRMYKGSSGGSGVTVFNGQVNLHIDGSKIVNDIKLKREIKMTSGENRDRFGF